ncbi:hypothetical protein C8J56DRAFT_1060106 [Mycena floridula]|nr:hypothetical protein C8J56DRAFT_1060106 [Mycena floridula]
MRLRQLIPHADLNDLTANVDALSGMFAIGTFSPHAMWSQLGIAIRAAQDIGAHRKKPECKQGDSVTEELLKRAWRVLFCRIHSRPREIIGYRQWLQWVISAYTLAFVCFMLVEYPIFSIPSSFSLQDLLLPGCWASIGVSVNPIMVIVLRAIQGLVGGLAAYVRSCDEYTYATAIAMIRLKYFQRFQEARSSWYYGAVGPVGNVVGYTVLGGTIEPALRLDLCF